MPRPHCNATFRSWTRRRSVFPIACRCSARRPALSNAVPLSTQRTPSSLSSRRLINMPVKRAVVVGVNDYSTQFPDGQSNLAGCVNDASSMYHMLTSTFGFDPSQTYYYVDRDASRNNILQALRYITSTAEPGD